MRMSPSALGQKAPLDDGMKYLVGGSMASSSRSPFSCCWCRL